MNKKIYLSPPHLTDEAMVYLGDAVASNWIAPVGPHVDAFERELETLLKVGEVLSTNSGTSAIHLGLLALGVGKGDEVICSTFTFCASVNPIIYCGAQPVFVDSESQSWNMDVDLLDETIRDRIKKGTKPKAIIVVHLYGMAARISQIMEVARRHNIAVIEDAAEALGSTYNGQYLGTFGDIGIFSFNGNKIITTSGGGALFSRDAKLIEKARYLRQEAKEPLPYYEHRAVGYNYRLSNLLAAVGRSQLKVLEARVKARCEIFKWYVAELNSIPGITFQQEPHSSQSNRWLTTIIIHNPKTGPEKMRLALADANIESRPLWKPMHLQPVFQTYAAYLNGVSEDLFNSGLCLPSGSQMEKADVLRISSIVKKQFD